ncbi:MAG: hypothetical protein R3D02_14465 [Hyphomicrobiales bacterium]
MRIVGKRARPAAADDGKRLPENTFGWASAAGLSALAAVLVFFLTNGMQPFPSYDDVEITGSIGPSVAGRSRPTGTRPFQINPYAPEGNETTAAAKSDIAPPPLRRSDTELRLLRDEISTLAMTIDGLRAENLSLGRRIATLEDALGSVTASIPDPASVAAKPKAPLPATPVTVEMTALDPATAPEQDPAAAQTPAPALEPIDIAPDADKAAEAPMIDAPAADGSDAEPLTTGSVPDAAAALALKDAAPTTLPTPKPEAVVPRTVSAGDVRSLSAPASRTSFGLDLGSAASMSELASKWAALNTVYGPALKGLTPVAAISEDVDRQIALRLIVGPFANAADAAARCAEVQSAGNPCKPAIYEGQRLDLR